MAEGALGISTGIGQGEAQIIKPFQSPVTPQQYGSAKQDKKSKTLANIETLDFKGMPNEAGLFAKAYDEIVKFVAENVDDPYVDIKMKQKISDLKTRANMSYDRKMAINNIVGDVQKGEGKNIYLGIDPALQEAVKDIDYNTFSNTEAYGKANAERIAKLNSVKTVPIYDIGAATGDLINQAGKWATINKNGRISETPDDVIDTLVRNELAGHPHAYATFERLMKNDPVGAKAANNQVDQYAYNVLRTAIKARAVSPEPKGSTFNFFAGGKDGAAISPTSAFEGSIMFGDQDDTNPNAFNTSQKTLFTTFQAKDVVIPVPEEAFSAKTIRKKGKGGAINSKVGGAAIVSTLSSPIEMFGVKIPAGTPIPDGAKPSEIYQLYVGEPLSQEDADIVDNVNEAAPNIAKGLANSLSKTTKQAFMIGLSSDGKTDSYIPFEYGYNAVRGGLSKDDVASYDAQIDNFLKLAQEQGVKIPVNIRAGGSYKPTTTGGAKTTSVPTVTQSPNFIRKNK
jgi:hypothetical protein